MVAGKLVEVGWGKLVERGVERPAGISVEPWAVSLAVTSGVTWQGMRGRTCASWRAVEKASSWAAGP